MTDIIQIGPLALSTERLAAVVSIWVFLVASAWIARKRSRASSTGWIAVATGILVARLAYVVQNFEAFRVEPLAAAYVWQGGFEPAYGIAAAALVPALMLRASERWMQLAALVAAAAGWFAVSAMLESGPVGPMPRLANVTDVRGAPLAETGIKGPLVVNLWATWCPPCRREMPRLQETADTNPDVPILLLNQGEEPSHVQRYLRKEGIDGARVLIDRDGGFGGTVGTNALPATMFVNSDGRIVRTHSGEISRAALLSGIRELRRSGLPRNPPEHPRRKDLR